MDHKLRVDSRHLVDSISEYILEFLNDFEDLGANSFGDLLADSDSAASFTIDAQYTSLSRSARRGLSFLVFNC